MSKISYGPYIKSMLMAAGDNGVSPADLFYTLKQGVDIYKSNATYASFIRYFYWYIQLGYVHKVRVEDSFQKGGYKGVLKAPKTYYTITDKGILANEDTEWTNPRTTMHPEWASTGYKCREYMAEYRKRKRTEQPKRRGRPKKNAA